MNSCVVAKNPFTPPDVLRVLSQDKEWLVRWNVAENPSTPSDILAFLSHDMDSWVRLSALSNPSTPYGIWIDPWGRVLP